jgi:hypothetical protein
MDILALSLRLPAFGWGRGTGGLRHGCLYCQTGAAIAIEFVGFARLL